MTEKIRVDCPECGGTGDVEAHASSPGDSNLEYEIIGGRECWVCGGTGEVWALPEEKEFDKYED